MRIIEGNYDDQPLKGPWNRQESTPPDEPSRFPEPSNSDPGVYRTGDEKEDPPLSGPWNREGTRDFPKTVQKEDPLNSGESIEYDSPSIFRKQDIQSDQSSTTSKVNETDPCNELRGKLERKLDKTCGSKGFAKNLFTPAGIYNGLVMAEILGSRGGRQRRR